MSLVNMKCPNCGASISLESSREEGFCSYCGSKVRVQRERTDKTIDIQNLLDLASTAIEAKDGQEALNYANKALEVDVQNAEAWFIKMQAQGLLAIFKDLKCDEIISAGARAMEFDDSEDMKLDVYSYYLGESINDFYFLMTQLQDTQSIEDVYKANSTVNPFTATNETLKLDSIMDLCLSQETNILSLRLAVPDSEITNNQDLAELCGELAKQLVYYQNAINERLNVCGTSISDNALTKYKNYLDLIKEGLPEEMENVVEESQLTNKRAGCYIATAIYGSYNCSQVWTLRRFRDYTLAQTWYGRAFIHTYYFISPTIVDLFGHKRWFNLLWRRPLDSFVAKLKSKGFEDTPYLDPNW